MIDGRLSILIPAYNPSCWLKPLLDSLREQMKSHPNTEIIVVDDGSTQDISFARDYPRTKYIRKEHGGVSSARNVAMNAASGEYIVFVDADDEVYSDYLSVVFENMSQGYDWVSYNWNIDGKPTETQTHEPLMINRAVWAYSFRADFIGETLFNESMVVGGDQEWLHRLLTDSSRHKYDNRIIYNYRYEGNENSLIHTVYRGWI